MVSCPARYNAHHLNLGQTDDLKSSVVKHAIAIDGHKTSVSLEEAFWSSLKEIADSQGITPSVMITEIDKKREQANLSSAIRLFVLGRGRAASVSDQRGAKVHRPRLKPSR